MAGSLSRRGEERRSYWLLILPAVIIYLFVMAFPSILSILLSFSDYNGGKMFGDGATQWKVVGFGQYGRLFQDPLFWNSFKNNVYIILISVFVQIPLGFIFAYFIFRKLVKWGDFWQSVIYLPAVISTIVIGVLWQTILSPYGPIGDFMNSMSHSTNSATVTRILDSEHNVITKNLIDSFYTRFPQAYPAQDPADYLNNDLALLDSEGTGQIPPESQVQAAGDLATSIAALNGKSVADNTAALSAVFAQNKYQITDDLIRQIIAVDPDSFAEVAKADYFLSSLVSTVPLKIGDTIPEDQRSAVAEGIVGIVTPKWSPTFMNKPDVSMIPILLVIVWAYTGLYLIIFLANMQGIDVSVIEAARIDGAGEGQIMMRIMVPAMSGIIVTCIILAITGSMNSFALVWAMTGGGPVHVTEILSIYAYNHAFAGHTDYPLANAISTFAIAISLILVIVTKYFEKRLGSENE